MANSFFIRLNLAAALVSAAVGGGCDRTAEGGGSGSGGGGAGGGGQATAAQVSSTPAAPSAGAGDQKPCGAATGGPACQFGSACDPENDQCGEAGPMQCQIYNKTDCSLAATPVCDSKPLTCGMAGQPFACECSGEITPADCARDRSGISSDPTTCAGEATFACGRQSCREWLDVCVQTAYGAPDGQCVPATELGCRQYGVADCFCVEEGESTCYVPGTFEATYLVNEVQR